MSVTIEDVAEEAGVSITTVSAVINDTRYVSPQLTSKVEQAIEELDYHLDQLGRGLRKGQSNIIGLLISDITNPFYPKVARGVEDCARENGYNLILCNTDEDPIEEKHYLSLLRPQRVDGMIVTPTMDGAENIESLSEDSIPMVLIDRSIGSLDYTSIVSDNYNGSYRAAEYLIDMGHREIGFVAGIEGVQSVDQRLAVYEDALKNNNIGLKEELIVTGNSKLKEGYEGTERLLEDSKSLTATFAANNLMLIGVLQYLKDHSIPYPDELSIISFDDPDWAAAVNPSITTISQNPYKIGYKAGSKLFKSILDDEKHYASDERVVLPIQIVKRESVKEVYP